MGEDLAVALRAICGAVSATFRASPGAFSDIFFAIAGAFAAAALTAPSTELQTSFFLPFSLLSLSVTLISRCLGLAVALPDPREGELALVLVVGGFVALAVGVLPELAEALLELRTLFSVLAKLPFGER